MNRILIHWIVNFPPEQACESINGFVYLQFSKFKLFFFNRGTIFKSWNIHFRWIFFFTIFILLKKQNTLMCCLPLNPKHKNKLFRPLQNHIAPDLISKSKLFSISTEKNNFDKKTYIFNKNLRISLAIKLIPDKKQTLCKKSF